MKKTLVWGALGYGLTTIFWFIVSPILTDEQERLVGWLLMGAYFMVIAVGRSPCADVASSA